MFSCCGNLFEYRTRTWPSHHACRMASETESLDGYKLGIGAGSYGYSTVCFASTKEACRDVIYRYTLMA